MSQDQNKFDPKETTEAKLCAYVDGELDAAGRAEIEKYLETNPQHRKLLEELKQTRDLMRALPRASAPPEIGEMLQGQLERSLLLNELDSEPAADSMRISRAAQFRAVAAVILLALGLGAVVYFVLPSSNQHVAVVSPPPTERELNTSATQIVPEIDDSASRTLTLAPAPSTSPAPAAPAPTELAERDPFARADADRSKIASKAEGTLVAHASKGGEIHGKGGYAMSKALAGAGAQTADPFRSRVQQTIANVSQGQSRANYTCVVVSTPDPAATKQRVNTFLASNKIQWQPVAEPMPQPIQFAQSQVVMPAKLNQTTVHLRRPGDQNSQNNVVSNSNVASNGSPQSAGTQFLLNGTPSSAPATQSYALQSSTAPSGFDAFTQNQNAPAQVPVRQEMKQQAEQLQTTAGEQSGVAQAIQPLDLKDGGRGLEESEQYIVARNMTDEQTTQLKDLLSREGGSQTIEVFDASTNVQQQATTQSLAFAAQLTTAPIAGGGGSGLGGADKPVSAAVQPLADTRATSGPSTNVSAATTSVPATQLLALQQKLQKAATTESSVAVDGQLALTPSTKPTQDVVIVLRNDAVNVQAQVAAPTTASTEPVAQQVPTVVAPVAAPATTPATTQAAP